MVRRTAFDVRQTETNSPHMRSGAIDRRSLLAATGRLATGGLTAWALAGMVPVPRVRAAQQLAGEAHEASARVVERLRTGYSFQISVDVSTIEQGLTVAAASLDGGVDILEMGTPLLKNAGVSNVVPAFRRRFPDALLLADMKTMDGGGGEARSVYAGGANVIDFLALSGVETARSVCAVRDDFRRKDPAVARLAFADILVPHQGPAAEAVEVAERMLEAGVDGVGVHLQADARRADPSLMQGDYLAGIARAVFDRVGERAIVQVVGGLSTAQAQELAKAGLRAFVISGNLGEPDTRSRYGLPAGEIAQHVAAFIKGVSGGAAATSPR